MARTCLCMCDCQDAEYRRIKRSLLTRLIWLDRRMFRCSSCDAVLLVPPEEIALAEFRQRLERFPFPLSALAPSASAARLPADTEKISSPSGFVAPPLLWPETR